MWMGAQGREPDERFGHHDQVGNIQTAIDGATYLLVFMKS